MSSTSVPPMSQAERANSRNAVIAGFLGWTLDAFDFFILTYVLAQVASEFHKTVAEMTFTITASLMMRPVGAILFGLMADRYGRRLPLMVDVLFYSAVEVLSGFAPSFRVFLILRLLYGIGMGGEWGVGASLAMESVPAKWRGMLSGLLQEGYALGNLLAAVAFWTVFPHWGWRPMFFIGGLPALLTLFIERNRPENPADDRPTPDMVDGHIRQYRQMALGILDRYEADLKDYFALLDVALNEHLLVVALDGASDEHLLTYESPLYVNDRSTPLQGLWRTLRASGEGYYVQYTTSIPSTLRSYHLIFESAPGVDISRIFLSTDADSRSVTSLAADLTFLADRLGSQKRTPMDEPAKKLMELEAQTALRRLAELVRRRRWEASHAGIALPERYLPASLGLTHAAVAGEASVGPDGSINNSILKHPQVSPEKLRCAARELVDQELLSDLSLERDPVTNRAHAYWRRTPERSVNSGPIEIQAGAILQDATGAGPRISLKSRTSI